MSYIKTRIYVIVIAQVVVNWCIHSDYVVWSCATVTIATTSVIALVLNAHLDSCGRNSRYIQTTNEKTEQICTVCAC